MQITLPTVPEPKITYLVDLPRRDKRPLPPLEKELALAEVRSAVNRWVYFAQLMAL